MTGGLQYRYAERDIDREPPARRSTIINPTNGAAFIAPASFTLAANAFDSDGFVTNVEFYLFNTNKFARNHQLPRPPPPS